MTYRTPIRKIKHLKSFFAVAAGLALIITTMTACTQTPTPMQAQTTDTRLGKLSFENGFPTEEMTRKLFDEMDYQRRARSSW